MRVFAGYTLIELLVVMGLVFVIAALVIQRPALQYDSLLQEACLLKTTCQNMQQLALASGEEHVLTLHMNDRCYEFDSLQGLRSKHEFSAGINYGIIPGTFGPPAHPTSVISRPCTFEFHDSNAIVRFFPTGGMSSGALYLIDHSKTHVIALTNGVSGQTALRIYELDAGAWKELKS